MYAGMEESEPTRRPRKLSRRARYGLVAGVLALSAAAVLMPVLVLADDDSECRTVPAETAALADDPEAATRALDPGQGLAGIGEVRTLLGTQGTPLCAGKDGSEAAGRVLLAATTGARQTHTLPMARVVHATVIALGREADGRMTAGLEPYVARVLAAYIGDFTQHPISDVEGPAFVASKVDEHLVADYPYPGEAHAVITRYASGRRALVRNLAGNPESFAVLYDADRAHLAYYLERLDDEAANPTTTHGIEGTETDLYRIGELTGLLMRARAFHAESGTIDLDTFDRAVLRHSRGTYRAAAHQVTSYPPAGTIATRAAVKADAKDFMDGHAQILAPYDAWARERGIDPVHARQARSAIQKGYNRELRDVAW
ncbi:hypothetical protein [Streptomyces coffeae]|uniref:Uncharacterized protein n=1 Tax=Streptomyces coffeae TaxID=621382 RepID=A0ABS1NIJ1_9ACTN|nr:hypothetical protein [Streptomyces coffeae]MBL1099819.1 hypothetical protein [Streptomyces coffeae]